MAKQNPKRGERAKHVTAPQLYVLRRFFQTGPRLWPDTDRALNNLVARGYMRRVQHFVMSREGLYELTLEGRAAMERENGTSKR